METKFFIESLGFNLSSLIDIDNVPFLVDLSTVFSNNNWVGFNILAVFDIEN
jgi:hypothetical protein